MKNPPWYILEDIPADVNEVLALLEYDEIRRGPYDRADGVILERHPIYRDDWRWKDSERKLAFGSRNTYGPYTYVTAPVADERKKELPRLRGSSEDDLLDLVIEEMYSDKSLEETAAAIIDIVQRAEAKPKSTGPVTPAARAAQIGVPEPKLTYGGKRTILIFPTAGAEMIVLRRPKVSNPTWEYLIVAGPGCPESPDSIGVSGDWNWLMRRLFDFCGMGLTFDEAVRAMREIGR